MAYSQQAYLSKRGPFPRQIAVTEPSGVTIAWSRLRNWDQAGDGCPEVRGGVVPELGDQRMAIENGLYEATLDATAATVDKADFGEAEPGRRADVFLDDRRDIARRERVQVDLALDRDPTPDARITSHVCTLR